MSVDDLKPGDFVKAIKLDGHSGRLLASFIGNNIGTDLVVSKVYYAEDGKKMVSLVNCPNNFYASRFEYLGEAQPKRDEYEEAIAAVEALEAAKS